MRTPLPHPRPPAALHPLALAALLMAASPGMAQVPARPAAVAIAAQPLGQALNELARQAQWQLSFPAALVAGKTAPALSGQLTPRQALDRLLAGSGLAADIDGQAVTVRPAAAPPPAPAASRDAALEPVTVTAQAVRDAATEGSGSYGARGVTIGKSVQTLREIPQSVSVVTRQQMDDQNLTTVEDALRTATGVTAISQGEGTAIFYSRGYTMNAQYDGVPAGRQIINGYKQLDTAVYDRIEVLRGPSGLLQGSGEPGGTVNLVRKGPLDQLQLSGSVSAGSWSNHRTEIDLTGPLDAAGRLRGRMVLAAEDRGYHYGAHHRQQLAYGTLDWDLTPDTLLSLTATRQHSRLTGRSAGLPTYADGRFLDVPRSASVGASWQRWEYPINEYAAELTHRFGTDWKAKLSVRQRQTDFDSAYLETSAGVDPAGMTTDFSGRQTQWPVRNQDLDLHLTGPFALLGRRHELTLGMNRSKVDVQGGYAWSYFTGRDVFDPGITPADLAPGKPSFQEREIQSGLYGAARLKVADPLTLVLGGRLSRFLIDSRSVGDSGWSDYSKARNEFTPYGGLVWDIDRRFTAYASYADIFVPQGDRNFAGQRLEPRVGWQAEAGVKAELLEQRLNASLAVFRIRDKNRSIIDPDPSHVCDTWNGSCSIAAGLVQSQGIEAELSGRLAPHWNITGGYTYNRTRYLRDGDPQNQGQPLLTHIPTHLFKLWTQYAFTPRDLGGALQGWSLGAGITAQSGMRAGGASAPIRQAGFATVHLRVGYRISKQLSATLSIHNLMDRRYYESLGSTARGNYFGAPRNAMLSLRATY